jgi:hypothetical protein
VSEVWDDPAYAQWKHRTLEAVKAEAARASCTNRRFLSASFAIWRLYAPIRAVAIRTRAPLQIDYDVAIGVG